MNTQELIVHTEQAIQLATEHKSKLPPEILRIQGFSSPKVRHFLNNLLNLPGASYLEIGTYKGSTLVSALHGNEKIINRALAIDNFTEFDGPRQELHNNVENFIDYSTFRFDFIDGDCWAEAVNLTGTFNIYFYDGHHEEEDQYKAFTEYNHLLESPHIAVIDDYNWGPVRAGTERAFKDLNYRVARGWELPARYNGDVQQWWHGLGVFIIEK
jgi:hypothetical protein